MQNTLTRRFGPVYYGIDYGLVPLSDNDWKCVLEQTNTYHGGVGRLSSLTSEKWERLLKRLGVLELNNESIIINHLHKHPPIFFILQFYTDAYS